MNSDDLIEFSMKFNGFTYQVRGAIRPGAYQFIEKMSQFYEIVVFTASLPLYAKKVVRRIDKGKKVLCCLTRNDCTVYKNNFIKDLRRFGGRDLKDIVIIDNNPVAFAFTKENGIPILSWFDDMGDVELELLIPKLEELAGVDDVRGFTQNFYEPLNGGD